MLKKNAPRFLEHFSEKYHLCLHETSWPRSSAMKKKDVWIIMNRNNNNNNNKRIFPSVMYKNVCMMFWVWVCTSFLWCRSWVNLLIWIQLKIYGETWKIEFMRETHPFLTKINDSISMLRCQKYVVKDYEKKSLHTKSIQLNMKT